MSSISDRFQTLARRSGPPRWLLPALAAAAFVVLLTRPAQAQFTAPCPAGLDLSLTKLPEIASQGGRLKGLIVLADGPRSQPLPSGQPNPPTPTCVPQLRRYYQPTESTGTPDGKNAPPPIPGPTLRASLGDVVELTFLNQINPIDYGNSIDVAENLPPGADLSKGAGCDSVNAGYPRMVNNQTNAIVYDTMPNCFHGSSTGNLHFHGTHTSPMGTADNVYLQIRPSPRPNNGPPTVTEASVAADFDTFFRDCEQRLKANNLLEWPLTWTQMGIPNWTSHQETLVKASPQGAALWKADNDAIMAGSFPQYYVGSFPYCFLLPRYPGSTQPAGALKMGQAPGTMWYHAHKHGSTALNVSNSMAGAFIIEDNTPQGYDGFIKSYYLQHPNGRQAPGQTEPSTSWPILQTTMVVNQIAGIPTLETGPGSGSQSPFSINGQQVPQVSMQPGEVQLWRIVNASTISGFYLNELPAGFVWRQTAQDGVQFDDDNYRARAQRPVFVAPGNRIDLLVQAPASTSGGSAPVMVAQAHSQSTAQSAPPAKYKALLIIVVTNDKPTPMPMLPAMPARPPFLNDIETNEVKNSSRFLTFQTAGAATGASQHTIAVDNGPQRKFGEDGTAVNINPLNTVEEWTIYNISNAGVDHPFHIHINPFQVTEVFAPNAPMQDASGHTIFTNGQTTPLYVFTGTCVPNSNGNGPNPVPPCKTATNQCLLDGTKPDTWHPCASAPSPYAARTNIWWDVFPIPDATTVPTGAPGAGTLVHGYFKMRSRFVDYPGAYVLHCHILAHEDRGMMVEVNLAYQPPASAPMQHH
jgi:FtsP/CotA-like multicopper oxidase with cupredoxin domain